MKQSINPLQGRPWLLLAVLFAWLLPQKAAATYVDEKDNYYVSLGGTNIIYFTAPVYDMDGDGALDTKGVQFKEYLEGTRKIGDLQDGDRVLMLESCTHNVTCEDIGRVKLPKLLAKYTGKQLHCEAVAGLSALPHDLGSYALVIQCGGCVVTAKQLASRLAPAIEAGVPVSNYGLAIAYMNGIFERSMRIFRN